MTISRQIQRRVSGRRAAPLAKRGELRPNLQLGLLGWLRLLAALIQPPSSQGGGSRNEGLRCPPASARLARPSAPPPDFAWPFGSQTMPAENPPGSGSRLSGPPREGKSWPEFSRFVRAMRPLFERRGYFGRAPGESAPGHLAGQSCGARRTESTPRPQHTQCRSTLLSSSQMLGGAA